MTTSSRKRQRKHCVAASKLIERNLRQLKYVSDCSSCEEIRMKPVRAWAVVRDQRLQGQASLDFYVILVQPTRKAAKKRCVPGLDRVARVEIREVEE